MPGTAPCSRTKSASSRKWGMNASSQRPRSPIVPQPRRSTLVDSTITRPAPPTAKRPTFIKCQGVGNPCTPEYWCIGATTTRFLSVMSRSAMDENSSGCGMRLLRDSRRIVTTLPSAVHCVARFAAFFSDFFRELAENSRKRRRFSFAVGTIHLPRLATLPRLHEEQPRLGNLKGATTGTTAPRGFALDLAAVLAPYGRKGRLAVRVERMREGARLSKGRNNGDNTWSLAPEELEGVFYLPPDDRVHADRLALRIIELTEEGGITLAIVEFPLAPTDAAMLPPKPTAQESAQPAELDRLRRELAAATDLADARAAELAELRRAAELAAKEAASRTIESELTTVLETARAAWEAELQQRLGEAAASLETSRALAQAEHADALAQAAARGRAALEAARAEAKAEREVALEAARAEHAGALAAAEAAWRADAEVRLAEAEQRKAQAEQALTAAEARWQAEADARLAEAERRQAQAEQALAAVTARLERTERALNEVQAEADADDGEVRRLRDALAALTQSHETAKGELAHWRQRAELAAEESAKKRDAGEVETALATARGAWETELTRRLEEAAAAAEAHLAASRAAWQAAEAECRVAAEARLEERIEERLAAAREEGRQAAAPATATAPDTAALAEAQAAHELAALTKRLERSDAALAQARTHAERDEAELARLRQGVA